MKFIKSIGFVFAMMLVTGPVAAQVELAQNTNWAVYTHAASSPPTAAVAPFGSLGSPWTMRQVFYGDASGAWRYVCNLTIRGDAMGRTYQSPDIASGRVSCNSACVCSF